MRMDRYGQEAEHKKRKKKRTGLKTAVLIILILLLAITATGIYIYRSTLASLSISFTDNPMELEFGETYDSMEFVKAFTGDVLTADGKLETDSVGSKVQTYTVSRQLFWGLVTAEKEFILNYSVIDTTPPLILWNGSGAVLQNGTEFDINKVLGYGDNADPKPSLTVDGKVDMNKNGKYPLKIKVTDASGNTADAEMTIEVADSVPTYSGTSEMTSFTDFNSRYRGDGKSFGIDVSTWQGDIDFEKVKTAGCEFVIIRIGYSVDGEVNIDSKFEQNYKNAKAADLSIGIYLYSYDNTEEEVRKSANWIADKLAGDRLDLPVVFDWEDFGEFQLFELSFTELNNLYDAFDEELSGKGYDTMLYGSKNFLEKVWTDTDTRSVWLAHYTDKTDYSSPYRIWQASQTGRIDGIDGAVDFDIMYE